MSSGVCVPAVLAVDLVLGDSDSGDRDEPVDVVVTETVAGAFRCRSASCSWANGGEGEDRPPLFSSAAVVNLLSKTFRP